MLSYDNAMIMCAVFCRDVLCGMLHCEHRTEKLSFWKEALSYTILEDWVMANSTRHDCKGAILDVGLDSMDPGMVPNGAWCGHNKVHLYIYKDELPMTV